MHTSHAVEQGRGAFERRAWRDAYRLLEAADRGGALEADDLALLATAARLIGLDAPSADAWERAHQAHLDRGDVPGAVRCAFWLAVGLLQRGEVARGGGWLARAQRHLEACGEDCVEAGYVLFPSGVQQFGAGNVAAAHAIFTRAAEHGERFGDADLVVLATHGQGRALLRLGAQRAGLALLDEAMLAVTGGETSPLIAGDVYCSAIEGCQEVFDVHRAREWTAALSDWCAQQPDLVPYRGQCLVHRSQVRQLHGEWREALEEARQACARLSDPPGQPALGLASYQRGELHRLRGEHDEAEAAYRAAGEHGHVPHPGLALLRLAQGRADAAAAAIARAVDEVRSDRVACSHLLPAQVEILVASGDLRGARRAADELGDLAEELAAPLLEATAAQADGTVLLAHGDARRALPALRRAWTRWWELSAPYEAARARVLIGLACRRLDDEEGARMEWDTAAAAFEAVGAVPDLRRLEELREPEDRPTPGGLTDREVQVLRLVATGRTNRQIAAELGISQHTARRHLQNIFVKLAVPSRAAATAYAFQHGLA